jgi:endonuclease YncB( thermonuclease family)
MRVALGAHRTVVAGCARRLAGGCAWRLRGGRAALGWITRTTPATSCLAIIALGLLFFAPAGAVTPGIRVERVLDGDSVLLADGRQVRYVGINAPEAGEPFSSTARAFNRELVEGEHVVVVPGRAEKDRYGRILGYVHLGERFVNAELLRAGLAHLFLFDTLGEERALVAAEDEARARRRGLWGPGGLRGPLRITAPRHPPASPLRSVTICNVATEPVDLRGFRLEAGAARFTLPAAALGRGHVALVLVRKGTDRLAARPLRIHWWPGARGVAGPSAPGAPSTLVLRSPAGVIVDRVDRSSD